MREQMTHGNLVSPFWLRAAYPFGQVALDGSVEIERNREITFRELGNERGRGDYFCERSDVVHRVGVNSRRVGGVAEISEGMQRNLSAIADGDACARGGFV